MISDSGHEMDALGHAGDEGRFRPRKSTVSCQKSVNPCVSEWRNPLEFKIQYPKMSEVVLGSRRRELKHLTYLQEKKSSQRYPK